MDSARRVVVVDEQVARQHCSAHSQAAMKVCLAKKALESDRELNQAEVGVLSSLSKWEEDAKYIRLATARLEVANKTFARYRAAQCAFAASLAGGAAGNALEMGRLACVAEQNSRHAAQLRRAHANLPLRKVNRPC